VPVSTGTCPSLRHNDAQRPPIPFSHKAFLKSMALALIRAFSELRNCTDHVVLRFLSLE